MIPLYDKNPTRAFPIITVALILANIAVFYWQYSGGPNFSNAVTGSLGLVPYKITHNEDITGYVITDRAGHAHVVAHVPEGIAPGIVLDPSPKPLMLTIFTAMFLHGGLAHIGFNMLFLWIFGNNVEDALGRIRYLLFYLGCGVAAAIAQTAASPDSLIPTIGASGAIAGILGAYIVMWPGAKVTTLIPLGCFWFVREISAFWLLGFWIALQAFNIRFGEGGESMGGVAYFAHLGGFIAGLIGILFVKRDTPPRRQRRWE